MKKRPGKTNPSSKKKFSWGKAIAVALVTLLLVGIVAAITKNEVPAFKAEDPKPVGQRTSKPFVTTNAAGQLVVVNQQTGQHRPLTLQEQTTLAAGIKQLVNQETDGLVQIEHANGAVSMNLDGHFQNVAVARKEADGTVSQSCVNDLESAAAFFEIDPALLGVTAPVQSGAAKAAVR